MISSVRKSSLDIPPVNRVDGARDELLANGAKLLNESDITLEGIVGRELIVDHLGGIFRAWIFFVSGRFYNVSLATKSSFAFAGGKPSSNPIDRNDSYEKLCSRFFSSFRLATKNAGAGDAVLVAVARAIRHALRPGDFCARMGGEEFCVVLAEIETDAKLLEVTERVREAIEATRPAAFPTVSVTASVGALRLTHGLSVSEALSRSQLRKRSIGSRLAHSSNISPGT